MRLVELRVAAFGKFVDRRFSLGEGLNLIYGPNEAGKSTLHKFILGMLYGFQRPGARRRQPTEDLSRYQPWNAGSVAGGSLIYRLDRGQTFRVEREFRPDRTATRVFDEVTGREVTGDYPMDQRRELLFAQRQLGLSDAAFTNTACIGQLQAADLDQREELASRIANLRESGQEDLSVRQALAALDTALEEIGSDRAPTRPLGRAMDRVRALEEEARRVEEARQANLQRDQRLREIAAERQAAATELAAARAALTRARAAELESSLQRLIGERQTLAELDLQITSLAAYSPFPAEEAAGVEALAASIKALEANRTADGARLAEAQKRLASEEGELRRFAPFEGFDGNVLSEVGLHFGRYERTLQELEEKQREAARVAESLSALQRERAEGEPLAQRGEELASRLDAAEQARRELREQASPARVVSAREGWRRQALAARGRLVRMEAGALLIALVAGVVAYFFATPPLWGLSALGLLAGVAAWWLTAPQRREVREHGRALAAMEADLVRAETALAAKSAEIDAILKETGIAAPAELRQRLINAERTRSRCEAESAGQRRLTEEIRTLRQRLDEDQGVLGGILAAAEVAAQTAQGAPGGTQISRDQVERFQSLWQAYLEQRQKVRDAAQVAGQLQSRISDREGERNEAQRRLTSQLQGCGAITVEDFLEGCRRKEELVRLQGERETRLRVLLAALGQGKGAWVEGPGPGGWAASMPDAGGLPAAEAELRTRLAALLEQAREEEARAGGSPFPPAGAERLIETRERQLAALDTEEAELRGASDQALSGMRDPAEIDREQAAARAECERLALDRRALELARDTLVEAANEVHREFAPRLNQAVGGIISRLTGGRYDDVRVDEQLGLSVSAPEDGRLRPVSALSRGTLDQFYLALRLAMAELLAGSDAPGAGQGEVIPLLLDDTFVQVDDRRVEEALGYLAEECRRGRQVVLFTCHRREVEIARRVVQPGELHLLELDQRSSAIH